MSFTATFVSIAAIVGAAVIVLTAVLASDVTNSCGTSSVSRRGNWTPKGPPDRPLQFAARRDDEHEAAFSPEITREALPTVIATCISARCPIGDAGFALGLIAALIR